MKLLVFPEALRQQVEAAAVEALGEGHEGLTITVARLPATNDWAVYATGLDDAVLPAPPLRRAQGGAAAGSDLMLEQEAWRE